VRVSTAIVVRATLFAALLADTTVPTLAADAKANARQIEFFEKRIRPVLVARCYECHSRESDEIEGGLLLDTRDGTRQGGESGEAVVPGDPSSSLLIDAIRYEGFEMPPDEMLPDDVIADFTRWIEMGAPDPRDGKAASEPKWDDAERRDLWSLTPPHMTPPPKVHDTSWPRNGIDRFVLAKLEEAGMRPVGDADRLTLLRRVHFALVGLPPSPEEIDAFAADPSDTALAHVVDRLLASPQFGERWGRHWLDVARFAESNGMDRDVIYPHAWRYRNWVIDAMSSGMAFDRFIAEQIAGDLMPCDDGACRDDQYVATGFLAVGPKPLSQRGEQLRMDTIDEQIDVVSRATLGLTVSCARCHDHKFDPIPTTDYYAMAGLFRSTETLFGDGRQRKKDGSLPLLQPIGPDAGAKVKDFEEHRQRIDELTKARDEAKKRLAELQKGAKSAKPEKAEPKKKVVTKLLEAQPADKAKADAKSDRNAEKEANDESAKPTAKSADSETIETQVAEATEALAECEAALKAAQKSPPPVIEFAMAVRDFEKPEDCRVHIRGEIGKLGDAVPRGFVSAVDVRGEYEIDSAASGRLELAEWLTDPSNPLTARVAVNRVWAWLFGRGIVPTVDNCGRQGEPPSHPELLDYLAVRFVEEGWSIKRLIREIVLSRTYQLASDYDADNYAVDPDGATYWRMRPQRLDVESMRDAILAASGELDLARPERSPVAEVGEGEVGRGIDTRPLEAPSVHRSVYLPIVRGLMPEILKVFDFAEPSIVVGQRNATNVPAQALYMMNSPFIMTQSEHLARRLLDREDLDDAGRVELAYKLCFGRSADDAARHAGLEFVERCGEQLKTKEPDDEARRRAAWTTYCQALFASGEFRYLN